MGKRAGMDVYTYIPFSHGAVYDMHTYVHTITRYEVYVKIHAAISMIDSCHRPFDHGGTSRGSRLEQGLKKKPQAITPCVNNPKIIIFRSCDMTHNPKRGHLLQILLLATFESCHLETRPDHLTFLTKVPNQNLKETPPNQFCPRGILTHSLHLLPTPPPPCHCSCCCCSDYSSSTTTTTLLLHYYSGVCFPVWL